MSLENISVVVEEEADGHKIVAEDVYYISVGNRTVFVEENNCPILAEKKDPIVGMNCFYRKKEYSACRKDD